MSRLPAARAYCVAYSGGVDSHVLLHLLATARERLPARLCAVHIDHGLHTDSHAWSEHCRGECRRLDVALTVLEVDARAAPGESPEAAARSARYRALAGWLADDALLLTAQHRDDQAETLLLQLFRGAGPRGLAGMPEAAAGFGRGRLMRPLLAHTREEILAYAEHHGLRWVEDPSNADTRYSRNFLRHRLIPVIREHWPGVDAALARASALQADQAELATALAALDLSACAPADAPAQLAGECLNILSGARQRNLLRHWLQANGLPLPPRDVLERVRGDVLGAAAGANPLVHWPGGEVRRYRGRLYAMTPLPVHDTGARFDWQVAGPLHLDAAGGTLNAEPGTGGGLDIAADAPLQVRFRQGGERLRPAGRRGHHLLKKLFQEHAVPEWERDRVPLIYQGETLLAVAGVCIAEGHQARTGRPGYRLSWSRL